MPWINQPVTAKELDEARVYMHGAAVNLADRVLEDRPTEHAAEVYREARVEYDRLRSRFHAQRADAWAAAAETVPEAPAGEPADASLAGIGPGLTIVVNRTGRPESLLRHDHVDPANEAPTGNPEDAPAEDKDTGETTTIPNITAEKVRPFTIAFTLAPEVDPERVAEEYSKQVRREVESARFRNILRRFEKLVARQQLRDGLRQLAAANEEAQAALREAQSSLDGLVESFIDRPRPENQDPTD